MKLLLKILFTFTFLIPVSWNVYGAEQSDIYSDFTIPDSNLSFDNVEAEKQSGELIGDGWQVFTGPACESNLSNPKETGNFAYFKIYDSANRDTGLTVNYEGTAFTVYNGTTSGIGYAWGFREVGTTEWRTIKSQYYDYYYAVEKPNTDLMIEIAYARVRVDGLPPSGKNRITRDARAFITCYKKDNSDYYYSGYVSNGFTTVTSTVSTCNIDTKTLNVDLGDHNLAEVSKLGIGDNFGFAQEDITMSCHPGIRVYATIGEHGRASNIGSNVIQLTDTANSPGYGVQVFYNNDSVPLHVGGDDKQVGSYHRFLFRSESAQKIYNLPFIFKYVKTGSISKPSSGNAALTITFGYD